MEDFKVKWYLLIILILAFTFAGCVNVKFVDKNGTTVTYTRFLTDVEHIEGTVADNRVVVGGSTVNVEALTNLFRAVPK